MWAHLPGARNPPVPGLLDRRVPASSGRRQRGKPRKEQGNLPEAAGLARGTGVEEPGLLGASLPGFCRSLQPPCSLRLVHKGPVMEQMQFLGLSRGSPVLLEH